MRIYPLALVSLACCLYGCASQDVPLMPTPVIYQNQAPGPLDHIPEDERWNLRRVYYVTTRQRDPSLQRLNYGNRTADQINVGMAMIGFGRSDLSWADLNEVSKQNPREDDVPLSIAGIFEAGSYRLDNAGELVQPQGAAFWLLADIDEAIAASRDRDVLVYVHGAAVNFYNACAFAAQLDHFMGRDMTSLAFSWPTRQTILAYGLGGDVKRAYASAPALTSVLEQLAAHTAARRIHILTWSAGGRVVSAALKHLREKNPTATADQLRKKYRLGSVYFAAADVPVDEFVQALGAINDLTDRIVVTASSGDDALQKARLFMGGATRIGQINPRLSEEQKRIVLRADRLEYVNLSLGSGGRGFDITGHHYWFNHPWASSDALLSIRTDLTPEERGLQRSEIPMLWWMPEDYPQRVRNIVHAPPATLRK